MPKLPHILIFNPDQWRGDVLGHLDNPAAVTPTLDALAASEAVSFRNAFTQNPVCTPSRCAFMTGWYPHVHGHRTMFHMLRPHEPVLIQTLMNNGYYVWWGGKNDLTPAQLGYKDYCNFYLYEERERRLRGKAAEKANSRKEAWRGEPGGDNYYSFYQGRIVDERPYRERGGDWHTIVSAVDFIRSAPRDKPLCIYLPIGFPHPVYRVEEPYYSMIDRSKMPPRIPAPADWDGWPSMMKGIYDNQRLQSWTEDRWTELRAAYYGMCARVDHQFQMVLDALKDAGIYDDTAVFFFSDHGDYTGDYGIVEKSQNTFQDCLARVPFIIKPPAGFDVKPRVSDAIVELIDFPATVEAMTGIRPNHTHFGKSLLPVIAGDTDEHRDAAFCEGGRLLGETHCMELESASSQTPDGLYYPRLYWQRQETPHHTKAAMCRTKDWKYVMRLYERDELYDLANDPAELRNLAADPARAETLRHMKDRLLRWYMETCDVVPLDPDDRW